ncbi:PepSY domain-containing protein [Ectothiorhodospiraceae bacterium 2226]|nr:PepSY domain-containing protein [Ectothiorhodospiraceae bacterium 2226]
MKAKTLLVATLTASLLAGGAALASDLRHNEVYQLRESGQILAMEDILAHARKAQAGHLIEAELEREDGRYVYELKILDAQGQVHKLELDAASGEVLKRKIKD